MHNQNYYCFISHSKLSDHTPFIGKTLKVALFHTIIRSFKNHIEIETSKLIECGRLAGTRHPANRQTIRLYRVCKQNLRQLWNNKVFKNDKCYELNGINLDVLR